MSERILKKSKVYDELARLGDLGRELKKVQGELYERYQQVDLADDALAAELEQLKRDLEREKAEAQNAKAAQNELAQSASKYAGMSAKLLMTHYARPIIRHPAETVTPEQALDELIRRAEAKPVLEPVSYARAEGAKAERERIKAAIASRLDLTIRQILEGVD
jgi:hypothetical protein